jgi:undecaprenyl diphosphate synthase
MSNSVSNALPLPDHIAIIMDGNGRWATQRKLPRVAGHKKGADSVREVIESCVEIGVPYLTLYAFSSENWRRPADEVDSLMELLKFYLSKEIKTLHKNGIKLNFIGERSKLSKDIAKNLVQAEELTKENKNLVLTIALSYGSRQEIIHAAQRIAREASDGKLTALEINEQSFSKFLYTIDIPDPDLLIRTGGEQRLSNFLLWQSAYTELFFDNVLWPDFHKENLEQAILEFGKRERRYGTS